MHGGSPGACHAGASVLPEVQSVSRCGWPVPSATGIYNVQLLASSLCNELHLAPPAEYMRWGRFRCCQRRVCRTPQHFQCDACADFMNSRGWQSSKNHLCLVTQVNGQQSTVQSHCPVPQVPLGNRGTKVSCARTMIRVFTIHVRNAYKRFQTHLLQTLLAFVGLRKSVHKFIPELCVLLLQSGTPIFRLFKFSVCPCQCQLPPWLSSVLFFTAAC